jgi:radical SAM superfamily enzyme YgiQ (UPF0313 family)
LNDLNIGLKSIHSALLAENHQSYFLTIPSRHYNEDVIPELTAFITRIDPDIIGCSLYTNEFNQIKYFTSVLRKKFHHIPIIWGGVHPTTHPESCFPYADYVCMGEGERTILKIAQCIDKGESFENTRNLAYKKSDKLIMNPLYPAIEKLEDFPFPEFLPPYAYIFYKRQIQILDKFNYAKFARYRGRVLHALSSRGCPFKCSYCCNSVYQKIYGKKPRTRTVENLIQGLHTEIRKHKEIKFIFFYDENFLAHDSSYLKKFCDMYREKISKPFTIMSSPVYIDEKKIQLLKNAGLMFVQVGLQTGSDRIAKHIYKRNASRSDFIRAVTVLKAYNISTSVDVILDNPFENESDTILTISTLAKVPKPFNAIFFSLTFFHGTDIFLLAQRTKKIPMIDPMIKNSLDCTKNELNLMARLAVYLDEVRVKKMIKLYLKGKNSKRFRLHLFNLKLLSCVIYQPYWDLYLLYNANGRKLRNILRNIHFLLAEWFRRKFLWT